MSNDLSLDPGMLALPWLTYPALDWLGNYLRPDMRVWEWGSGGSTLYFADRVARVISVEHSANWFTRVKNVLARGSRPAVVDCRLRPPVENSGLPAYGFRSFTSGFVEYQGWSFEPYVREIESCPDRSFQVILVDGRARLSCLYSARSKVAPGGVLILDNSEREEYTPAGALMIGWGRRQFVGIGPHSDEDTRPWQTTIWMAPKAE